MNEDEDEEFDEFCKGVLKFLKEKRFSTRVVIIMLIITYACGFLWRGIYT